MKLIKTFMVSIGIILVVALIIFNAKYDISITGRVIGENNNYDDYNYSEEFPEGIKATWKTMPITYSYLEFPSPNPNGIYKCVGSKKKKIERAFNLIKDSTNNIIFEEVEEGGDIEISCLPGNPEIDDYYITIAEALPIIEGNEITSGTLTFYTDTIFGVDTSSCFETELHEILHLFNFDHSDDKGSVMREVGESICLYKIDKWIIEELNLLYD